MKHHVLSFTVENSLGLWRNSEDDRTYPVMVRDWRRFGKDLGESISDLLNGLGSARPGTFGLDSQKIYLSNQILHKKYKSVR